LKLKKRDNRETLSLHIAYSSQSDAASYSTIIVYNFGQIRILRDHSILRGTTIT